MRLDGSIGPGAPGKLHQRLVAELRADGCRVGGFPRWASEVLETATALRPDAYRYPCGDIDVFEVVVTNRISGSKLREYRRLVARAAELNLTMRVFRVHSDGFRECVATTGDTNGAHYGPMRKRGALRKDKVPRLSIRVKGHGTCATC